MLRAKLILSRNQREMAISAASTSGLAGPLLCDGSCAVELAWFPECHVVIRGGRSGAETRSRDWLAVQNTKQERILW